MISIKGFLLVQKLKPRFNQVSNRKFGQNNVNMPENKLKVKINPFLVAFLSKCEVLKRKMFEDKC